MGRHLAAAGSFVILAIIWTLPLSLYLSTHLPGAALGDNAVFLWNFWWMRTALASKADFFHTAYLFAPAGTDLTLHTHTALPAFAGATVLGSVPLIMALNITTLASLALNGICSYALAWRVTHDRAGALVAGIIFGCSPFIAAHLMGHFNLTAAWTIPLFALACINGIRSGSPPWAIVAGVTLAAMAYTDYYYVVYAAAFAVCVFLWETRTWTCTFAGTAPARWLLITVGALIVIDIGAIAAILVSGGFSWSIGSTTISAHDLFNPMQALGVLAVVAIWAFLRPSVRAVANQAAVHRGRVAAAMTIATFALLAAPILWKFGRLFLNGDYVTQQYYWRSAPAGIDAATLVLGNPFHGLWGAPIRDVYARLGIDAVESGAWLGAVAAILAIHAIRRRRPADRAVAFWAVVAGTFFIWSLGSHLHIAGWNTGLLTPAALLQFVPLVSNARMPGRAMVMVYLALAMLSALAISEYHGRHRTPATAALVVFLALAELWAAPLSIVRVDCPSIYLTLRDRSERGALVELPLGFGDGLESVTPVDNRLMLACQTVHEHPLVGGFVARLSPRVLAAYRSDPLLAGWLRLSGARGFEDIPLPDGEVAADRLRADGIRFIMVNRTTASSTLQQYVEHQLAVTKIAERDDRVLYVTH
jgi:hypothetical protein